MYGYRTMFCAAGLAGTTSRPMFADIRPNSSKAAEFISSWMPLGSIPIFSLDAVPVSRVLNPNQVPPWLLMRSNPSQLLLVVLAGCVIGVGGLLQSPLATKLVP